MIYIDIIDDGSPVRRKNIITRMQREMTSLLEGQPWKASEFESVKVWLDAADSIIESDTHIVFLHAPNQNDWHKVVRRLASNNGKGIRSKLVTYTGNDSYLLPLVGTIDQQKVDWWENYTGVRSEYEYPDPARGLKAGMTLPPVKSILSRIFKKK
jgi:hypothetical protein